MAEQLWQIIQITCTGIMTVGGAGTICVALYRWAKKPDTNRDEKLKGHDEKLDNDNRRIKALERRQEEEEEATTMLMRAILALMNHALDGNQTADLLQAEKDMQEFLIKKRRYNDDNTR